MIAQRMLPRPPGLHQVWPQSTPYKQQVPAPQLPWPDTGTRPRMAAATTQISTTTSTAPSTTSDMEVDTRGRSKERSSFRESTDEPSVRRRPRSSTRGLRKRRRGIYSRDPMDNLDRYVPSGWKMDLTHIVGCHYAAQIAPLREGRWDQDSQAFLQAMRDDKKEWLEIKELDPLNYMRYVANTFQRMTGYHLHGLSRYMGWIRASGYYHWKVAE